MYLDKKCCALMFMGIFFTGCQLGTWTWSTLWYKRIRKYKYRLCTVIIYLCSQAMPNELLKLIPLIIIFYISYLFTHVLYMKVINSYISHLLYILFQIILTSVYVHITMMYSILYICNHIDFHNLFFFLIS